MNRWNVPRDPRYPRRFERRRRFAKLSGHKGGLIPYLGEKIAARLARVAAFFRQARRLKPKKPFAGGLPSLRGGFARRLSWRLIPLTLAGAALIFLAARYLPRFLEVQPLTVTRARPVAPAPVPEARPLPQGLLAMEADSQEALRAETLILGPGGTISASLYSLGLTQTLFPGLLETLARVDSLSVVNPGAVFKVFWAGPESSPANFRRLEIAENAQARPYVVLPGGPTNYVGYSTEADPLTLLEATQGEIATSFYEAGIQAGLTPRDVMGLADVLASQVDFLTDPRGGDAFQVLYRATYRDGVPAGPSTMEMIQVNLQGHKREFFLYKPAKGPLDFFDSDFRSIRKSFLLSPLQYSRVSSAFSHARFHPIHKKTLPHLGVDYAAPLGTPVSAVADGTVKFAGRLAGYGNIVILTHAGDYETMYAHLSRVQSGVTKGQEVKQGDLIGKVGATGTATGPHLDFRLKRDGEYLDPEKAFAEMKGLELPPDERAAFSALILERRNVLNERVSSPLALQARSS
ncbi:MAG: M23 family metallopeptidase [Deltaproteobacteria bacterium]|jgi:murein DD-endopeptidase MepM/ murein hydrolase activator NlpD|nr:M23 family metallopeptidase [Deltaproteobacteria bacterium]